MEASWCFCVCLSCHGFHFGSCVFYFVCTRAMHRLETRHTPSITSCDVITWRRPAILGAHIIPFYSAGDEMRITLKRDVPSYPKVKQCAKVPQNHVHPPFLRTKDISIYMEVILWNVFNSCLAVIGYILIRSRSFNLKDMFMYALSLQNWSKKKRISRLCEKWFLNRPLNQALSVCHVNLTTIQEPLTYD